MKVYIVTGYDRYYQRLPQKVFSSYDKAQNWCELPHIVEVYYKTIIEEHEVE